MKDYMEFSSPVSSTCAKGRDGCLLVVLTGGPGAGKTAILEFVRRSLCSRIAVLPEAASILFGGGFWRHRSGPGRKAAQRAIFHIQCEQERMVREEQEVPFALCDRGTLDGLAYWPDEENAFWRELQTTREAEFSRYHAVIHLRTPSAERGYNHQNPLRTEDAELAHVIDERILRIWGDHPNRYIIDSTDDFMRKVSAAIGLLQSLLPMCCRDRNLALPTAVAANSSEPQAASVARGM